MQKRMQWLISGIAAAYLEGKESVRDVFSALGGKPDNNTRANARRVAEAVACRSTLQDAPRSGHPSAAAYIEPKDAQAAADAIRRGYTRKGERQRFRSWPHAVLHSKACEKVSATLAQRGVKASDTIIAAINKLTDTGIFMERVTVKRKWTTDNVAKRLRLAKANLHRLACDPSFLYRIVQVDSKKFRLAACLHKRWRLITADDPDVGLDEADGGLGAPMTINYYAAVNALVGVVAIVFVTGTSGKLPRAQRRFKVSRHSSRSACDCGWA